MIKWRMLLVFTVLVFLLGGCMASLQPVQVHPEKFSYQPLDCLTAGYSKTYFQSRFMGKTIGIAVAFGPLIGAALWQGLGNYDNKSGDRLAGNNDYEKLLGNFDTSNYFFQRLEQKLASSKYIKLMFAKDIDTANKIISTIKEQKITENTIDDKATKKSYSCVASIKIAYGLGARMGNEQFGFRKYYRPFIRVVGSAKNLSTHEKVWQDTAVVFSEKRYLGGDADAENISSAELISELKTTTHEAVDLLLRSLNGEQLKELPLLVDTNSNDFEF